MTDGVQIEQLIYVWLGQTYPDGLGHFDSAALDRSSAPIEIKMIPAFDTIEYNISNGGWAQFLWNCLGDWRTIIAIARQGYGQIGATEQAAVLDQLLALCLRDERACIETQACAEKENDGENRYFVDFTSRSPTDWERLFWSDSGIYQKRLAWLAANEQRIREMIGG